MGRIITAILFILIAIPCTASAQRLEFHDFRPHVGESHDRKLTVSVPLIPYMGTGDAMSFGSLSSLFDAFGNMKAKGGGTPYDMLNSTIGAINSFYGASSKVSAMALPSLKVGVSTKHFELKVLGGAASFTTAAITGPKNKLSAGDIQLGDDYAPYIATTPQQLFSFASRNILGGELWAVGKLPFKVRGYTLTALFGLGSAVGYIYNYTLTLNLGERITSEEGFGTQSATESGLAWNVNAMAGMDFSGWKWLRGRLVLELRDIYNGYTREARPELSIGAELGVWNILTFRADIVDVADPELRLEASRKFLGNNEIALGGVLRAHDYISRDFGYAMVGLGGRLVKVTFTCLFSKEDAGLMFGLNVGWNP